MNRTTGILVGVGALVLVLALSLMDRPSRAVPRLDGEPTVNLVVDPETGEREQLPMEQYIKGVVAGEMGQLPTKNGGEERDWPHEAYAAQAILARTFALDFLNEEGVVDISTDFEEAQAYNPDNISPAIEKAVDDTRGMVMVHNNEYVKAWFHSYSGGHTATAKEGLNFQEDEPGFIAARRMPENHVVPPEHKEWTAAFPLSQVQAALAELGVNVGQLQEISIADKGPSGRATTLTVRGSGGSDQVNAADFRIKLGSEEMKSTLLNSIVVRSGNLVLSGSGFGHGVGLSQWDAYQMAENGRSAEQILEAFFRDIHVGKAWD